MLYSGAGEREGEKEVLTKRSVSLSQNKKFMCSILIGANKNDRQREKTADFTLLTNYCCFFPRSVN